MKFIIGLCGLALLVGMSGCAIEADHYHRGGYYHDYRGEYPRRYYGHSERYSRYPYDRDPGRLRNNLRALS